MNISRPEEHRWQKHHYSHIEDKDVATTKKHKNFFQMLSEGLNNLVGDSFDRALVYGVPEQDRVSEEQEMLDHLIDMVDDVQTIKTDVEDMLESDISDDMVASLNTASGYASLLTSALLEAKRYQRECHETDGEEDNE